MTDQSKRLTSEQLYRHVSPDLLPFRTTDELEELTAVIGQKRAFDAVQFGTGMRHVGYHLFVMGPTGIGKNTLVRRILEQRAAQETTPNDCCYVHNFGEPPKPRALHLPPGKGLALRKDVAQLIEELHHSIPTVFNSDSYRKNAQEIEHEIKNREECAFKELQEEALVKNIHLLNTPTGYAFTPLINDQAASPDELQKLSEDEQRQIEQDTALLQDKLDQFIHRLPLLKRERRERIKKLNLEATRGAVTPLIAEFKKDYSAWPAVLEHLDILQEDVIENADSFCRPDEFSGAIAGSWDPAAFLNRYTVNVLVDHGHTHGAPIIYENLPSHQNLVGRIEHLSHMGALITNFTLIKPGVLHAANGGYLVLEAQKILAQPHAWESLKRALQTQRIKTEVLGEMLGFISTISLEPQPIPLNVKVVLLGERILYYLLCELDAEFKELFKVPVDFEETLDWTAENVELYARMIASLARRERLAPFDRDAVARLIEYSARAAGDTQKLSTHIAEIIDVMREADFLANPPDGKIISAADVNRAIFAKVARLARLHHAILEEIERGIVLIDIGGARVAQVNALSVFEIGDYAFGQPTRVTATVRLGEGHIVNIEREVELSGALHSKGVLILSSYLASRYAADHPLALSATLVFEQSYGMVDGDSASMAELAALLSALADIPIKQSLAISGSVNQLGQIQAIGAVNEKIEGFFALCRRRGLTGEQGVLIPQVNVQHLMLSEEVLSAVATDQFHIYPVQSADEAMELLTGIPTGNRDKKGQFPKKSLNFKVEERLIRYAQLRHEYGEKPKDS